MIRRKARQRRVGHTEAPANLVLLANVSLNVLTQRSIQVPIRVLADVQ